ncbi:D-2-hydroxyacid dehydrogenase [Colwellia sp. D2M02]|uniref:D-2-hydroxyacid dehydrogenase n=1 Tax=Colwellia sp. D2M02 TaxID=2841562 RepID=UPI001C09E977|nr:D-2-hydroxyacid dehydrogenase [Colwellia sp. D2M02]MBU2893095.1 D-2-hydroxyacid dehydrogenase [Colwellia sp. D2M02]
MHAVFLDTQTFSTSTSLSSISEQVETLTCYEITAPDEVLSRARNADIIITNKVVLNAELLASLANLKLICITATGFNNVDIIAAKKHNIAVTNVSGYAGNSVAQYVFAQLLGYYQQTTHHNANTEQGLWASSNTFCYHGNSITELAGKTIGVIGYGSLGQAVATIARAFSMKVIISERPNSNIIREGRLSFDEVIQQADILTLHCPQTADTENLINRNVLERMKNNAVLINTARGALVDELALLDALKNKKIAYAILDVLSQEPPPASHPLLNTELANLKITAHIAWASSEAQQRLLELVAQNILSFKTDERLNRLD